MSIIKSISSVNPIGKSSSSVNTSLTLSGSNIQSVNQSSWFGNGFGGFNSCCNPCCNPCCGFGGSNFIDIDIDLAGRRRWF